MKRAEEKYKKAAEEKKKKEEKQKEKETMMKEEALKKQKLAELRLAEINAKRKLAEEAKHLKTVIYYTHIKYFMINKYFVFVILLKKYFNYYSKNLK